MRQLARPRFDCMLQALTDLVNCTVAMIGCKEPAFLEACAAHARASVGLTSANHVLATFGNVLCAKFEHYCSLRA